MLGLETAPKPKTGRRRHKLRRSASETAPLGKRESAEGAFGTFEIISYAPLLRKGSAVVGLSLPAAPGDASPPLLARPPRARQSLGLSPSAVDLLRSSKYRASPYRAKQPRAERVGKVFLSERHSRTLSECGASYPGAPPATPTPALLQKTEYVPSMTDIRAASRRRIRDLHQLVQAQRSLQERLQGMKSVQRAKSEQTRRESERRQKAAEAERRSEEKRQQRRVIYALNEIMTRTENARFEEFMRKNGLPLPAPPRDGPS